MKIRRAAEHELLELWGYESIHTASSTAKFFCGSIKEGQRRFPRSGIRDKADLPCDGAHKGFGLSKDIYWR